MKRIYLRSVGDMDWADIAREVIRRPLDPQRGAQIEELRKGIRLLDALEAAEDHVLILEDADWEHFRDKVQAMQWGMVDRRLVEFVDDVLMAEENVSLNAQLEEAVRSFHEPAQ